ncbi:MULTISPECIES: fatty acid desaturase [Sorangium]|uniref:fatty acid desaturase n=1 Tax=Sorangium TaxID=39643 RepID=UPI003D9C2098
MGTTASAVKRHKFSKDILKDVRACYTADNWHGPLEIVRHWLFISFWVWFSCWSWRHLPLALGAASYFVAIFFIGGRQRALAGVLHQACHGTLMSNTKLGSIIGAAFAGYPVLQSHTGYRLSHVVNHHGRFGDPQRDPDYLQYQRIGLCGQNLQRAKLRSYLMRLAGPRSTLSYMAYLIRHRILHKEESTWERHVRLLGLLAIVVAAAATGWLGVLVAYWMVPLVTTQVWIGAVAELLEHYPLIETASRVDIRMTWNRDYGPAERLLLGEEEGEGYHLVHHLFPRVPLWRLKEVHTILRRDPAYAELKRPKGLAALSTIFASLPGPEVERSIASA